MHVNRESRGIGSAWIACGGVLKELPRFVGLILKKLV